VAANISKVGERHLPTSNGYGGWTTTRRFFSLLVAATALAGCGFGEGRQSGQTPSPEPPPAAEPDAPAAVLDSSIPEADPKKYADVLDPHDWKNPFLLVGADGIEIVVPGEQRSQVPAEALAEALAKLPASAWPYGRVVAARPRPGHGADAPDVQASVEEALAPLAVVVEWWPSE
jgi:hypothetical protein